MSATRKEKRTGGRKSSGKSVKSEKTTNSTKQKLPKELYEYRYFVNTNNGGAVLLPDIEKEHGSGRGVIIDFDQEGKTVFKIRKDKCEQSASLSHNLAARNLVEVTSQYLKFLESGESDIKQFSVDVNNMSNNDDPESEEHLKGRSYVHPGVESLKSQESDILPTLEELSKIEGSSDESLHKNAISDNVRLDADTKDIETILSDEDSPNSSGIVDPSIADRSNTNVDPRMFIKSATRKRPNGPKDVKMRPLDDPFSTRDVEDVIDEPATNSVEETPDNKIDGLDVLVDSGPKTSDIAKELLEEE